MVRKGLLKKATFKQRTDENYEASHEDISGKTTASRETEVEGLCGGSRISMFKEQQGGWFGQSRISQKWTSVRTRLGGGGVKQSLIV